MKKSLEVSFVVALSVMTVLATMTVIHDSNTHEPSLFTQWFDRGVRAISTWGEESAHSQPQAKGTQPTEKKTSLPTSTSVQSNGPAQMSSLVPGTQWGPQDFTHLEEIATTLFRFMTADEWKQIANSVAVDGSVNAATDVAAILNRHLSEDDQQWLARHFRGDQAFDAKDIELLQQVLSDLKNELTPDEQSLLGHEVGGLLGGKY